MYIRLWLNKRTSRLKQTQYCTHRRMLWGLSSPDLHTGHKQSAAH